MNSRILGYLMAGALTTALALAPPAFARGGGGGGGGMHGGGMGGGMHGGMGGGMHVGGMGMGGGMHTGGMHFGGGRFAGAPFAAHAGFSPGFSRFAVRDHGGFHHRFFHHRFHRFAFFGVPYAYAAYDSCYRRVWTPYGVQWVDVCGDYGY